MTLNERDLLWKERIEAFEASGLNGRNGAGLKRYP